MSQIQYIGMDNSTQACAVSEPKEPEKISWTMVKKSYKVNLLTFNIGT